MTVSNTMKIKQSDGSFKDVKISYIKPNGCAEEGMGAYASGSCAHAEGGNTNLMWKGGIYLTGVAGATSYTVTGIGASSIKKGDLIGKSIHDINKACVLEIEEDQIVLDHTLSKTTDFNAEAFGVLEGFSKIVGRYSHGEGYQNVAFGEALHAEGYLNTITGDGQCSHIEGYRNTISGNGKSCHAEGSDNKITHSLGGYSSHIEGVYNIIADGAESLATASHVNGIGNQCHGAAAQTIIGKYNEIDYGNDEKMYGNYSFIVGNGTSNGARSNAHTLDWSGNAWFAGNITVGVEEKRVPTLKTCEAQLEFNKYGERASISSGDEGGFHISSDGKTLTMYFNTLDFSSYSEVYIAQVKIYWYDSEQGIRRLYPNCSFYVDLLAEGDLIVDLPATPPLNTPIFISVAKLK